MRFLIITQIISTVTIASSAEANSKYEGHKKPAMSTLGVRTKDGKLSESSRGVFDGSDLGVGTMSGKGMFQTGAEGTGMMAGSGFETNGAFQTPGGGGVISGGSFQTGGAFSTGGMVQQNGGGTKYAQKMHSESSQIHHEEKMEGFINQGGGILGSQNIQCTGGLGGAASQDMSQMLQTISMNLERIYETVSSILNTQGRLSSRMDACDSKLQGIDSRIENVVSQIQSQTQYLQQVVQSTQVISSAVTELQQIETRNNDLLRQIENNRSGGIGGDLNGSQDDLRGTLQRIATQISQSFQDESIMIRDVKQAINSLANNVNDLSHSMQNCGGSSLTPDMLQSYFRTHQSTIVSAFRSEIRNILESIQPGNTNVDAGSISNLLRSSMESMYQLQTLLTAVNRMILEIHGRVMTGCTVHVEGGPGNKFSVRKEQRREHHSSINQTAEESSLIEHSGQQQMDQTQGAWPMQNQNWMAQRKVKN